MELARGASEPTSTRAIQVLGRIGDARALPLLLAIAQPESAAENAVLAYRPEVVDALLDALRREETYPAALRLLERIAPADDLPSMLAEAYATIEGDQRWGVANTVFRLSTDIYIEELAAAEQDRISKLIDDNPVVAVPPGVSARRSLSGREGARRGSLDARRFSRAADRVARAELRQAFSGELSAGASSDAKQSDLRGRYGRSARRDRLRTSTRHRRRPLRRHISKAHRASSRPRSRSTRPRQVSVYWRREKERGGASTVPALPGVSW